MGFVPIGFVLVIVVALAMDFWLFRSGGGLSSRAVGLRKESSLRVGVPVGQGQGSSATSWPRSAP